MEEDQQQQSPLLPLFSKDVQIGNPFGVSEQGASSLLRGSLAPSFSGGPHDGQKLSPYYPLVAAQSSSRFQQCLQNIFPYNQQHHNQFYNSRNLHEKFSYCNTGPNASSSDRFHPYAESKISHEIPFTNTNSLYKESMIKATSEAPTSYSSASTSSNLAMSGLPSYTSSSSPLNTLPSTSTVPNDLDMHTNILAKVLQSQFDKSSQFAGQEFSKEEFTRRIVEQYREEMQVRQAVSPLSSREATRGGPFQLCSNMPVRQNVQPQSSQEAARVGPSQLYNNKMRSSLIHKDGDLANLTGAETDKDVCSLPYIGKTEEKWHNEDNLNEMRSQSPPPVREELSPLPPELDIPSSLTLRGRLHSDHTPQLSYNSGNSLTSQQSNVSLAIDDQTQAPSSHNNREILLALPHSNSSNLLAHSNFDESTLPGSRSISTSDNEVPSQLSSLLGPHLRERRGKPFHFMPPESSHHDSDEMSSSQDDEFSFPDDTTNDPCEREGSDGDRTSLHLTKEDGTSDLRCISKVRYTEDNWDYGTVQPDRPEDFIFTTQELAERTAALKKVYSPEEAVECDLCGKVMRCSASLAAHMSKRHNKTLGEACFTCHLCGCVGTTRATLKRHLKRSHGTELHPDLMKKCGHCSEEVGASRSAVDAHIRARHPEQLSRYRQCSLCQALFTANASLARHLQRQHASDASVSVFECEHCNKRHYSYSQYTFHLKKVHQIDVKGRKPRKSRAKKPPCSLLTEEPGVDASELSGAEDSQTGGKVGPRKGRRGKDKQAPSPAGDEDVKPGSLLTDQSGQETQPLVLDGVRLPERKRYKCDRCMRSYRNHKNLMNHVLSKHEQPPKDVLFPCSKCDQVLLNSKARLRHMRTEHGERLQLRCGVCSLSFPTSAEYREHKAQHLFSCPHCGKTLMGRDSYREHLLIHTGPRLPCPHCTKTFTQNSNLRRHIRVHTGEKPYSCPYCTRRFSDKSACNSHVRVHTGAERCTCQFCGATFSKKQKLKYHMRMHTGQMLQCPLCPYAATMTYTLKKHLESHQGPVEQVLREAGLGKYLDQHPQLVTSSLQNLAHAATPSKEATASGAGGEAGRKDGQDEQDGTRDQELNSKLTNSKEGVDSRKMLNLNSTNNEALDSNSPSCSQRKNSENISRKSGTDTLDAHVKSEPTEMDQHDDTGYESLIPETNVDPLECEQAELMDEGDQTFTSVQEKDPNEVQSKTSPEDDCETLDRTKKVGESASDAKTVLNKLNEGILSNINSVADVWLKEEPRDECSFSSKTEHLLSFRSKEGADSASGNNFLEDCTEDFEQRLKMKAFMQDQCLERSARSIRRAIQREQDLHEQNLLKPKRKRRAKIGDAGMASDDEDRDNQMNALAGSPELSLHKINKTARLKLNADAMERVVGALIKRMMELSEEEEEEERDPGQMVGACLQVVLRDGDNNDQDQVVSVG